jgi:NAD(P)-dependent dehydrogenase (short-subunit alcohol dehydrogenase family)
VSYGASKLAFESLTRSAAYELGQLGITVNALTERDSRQQRLL